MPSRLPTPAPRNAVIVGANLNALGVARSLRKEGIPVTVITTSIRQPAVWSRGCGVVKIAALHGDCLISKLKKLRSNFRQNPVLFITDEMAVLTISERRDEVSGLYHFVLPTHETVLSLADKLEFSKLANAYSLPVPRTIAVSDRNDLVHIKDFNAPTVIKPVDKKLVHEGRVPRIAVARDHNDAKHICLAMLSVGARLLIQEWIWGDDTNITFCLFYATERGEIISIFTGRKLRSHPAGVGSTAICIAAPEEAEYLESVTRQFVKKVKFLGIGSIEFKRDSRDGRYLVVEPTVGRTDWQEEIATLCGENIPFIAYQHACGVRTVAREPLKPAVWKENIRHRLPKESLRNNAVVYDGYWRMNDPLPAVSFYVDWLLGKMEFAMERLNFIAHRSSTRAYKSRI